MVKPSVFVQKSTKWKKIFNLSAFLLFALTLAQAQPTLPVKSDTIAFSKAKGLANTKITYQIINAPQHTYGYNVLVNGKLLIHQPSIPGLPSNDGFKTKQDAATVALLVISKIRKGEMPPTVSIAELKKLNVIQK